MVNFLALSKHCGMLSSDSLPALGCIFLQHHWYTDPAVWALDEHVLWKRAKPTYTQKSEGNWGENEESTEALAYTRLGFPRNVVTLCQHVYSYVCPRELCSSQPKRQLLLRSLSHLEEAGIVLTRSRDVPLHGWMQNLTSYLQFKHHVWSHSLGKLWTKTSLCVHGLYSPEMD